jgi:nitrogenase-stabilizing/protective protein
MRLAGTAGPYRENEEMTDSNLELDLEELGSAEEFLDYFGIAFVPSVVQVNRLHILQRFHDYIDAAGALPPQEEARHALFRSLLSRAYSDFVHSDARAEKVFRVFRMHEPQPVFIPVDQLIRH